MQAQLQPQDCDDVGRKQREGRGACGWFLCDLGQGWSLMKERGGQKQGEGKLCIYWFNWEL